MNIKIKAERIIRACNRQISLRKSEEEMSEELSNHEGWDSEILGPYRSVCKFYNDIQDMAIAVEDTEYPYVTINREEFNKLEKYL